MRKLILIRPLILVLTAFISTGVQAQKFVHPGVLHTTKEFNYLYKIVQQKIQPGYSSYLLMKGDPRASADYKMNGPYKTIARDGEFAWTKTKMEMDFSAAYLNAIMWMVTKDPAHAKKSAEILTAYADSLTNIPLTNDAPLLAGLEGFKIVYAAEVLKYTYKEATKARLDKITKMITNVFLPVIENFYNAKSYTNGNWGSINTKTYMAMGIFLDNRAMYKKAVDFYLNANDNGTIKNYISGATGQIQESGRDQGHSQLGIGAMATICEEAWKQGDDLYSALDNRLMLGFEYVAKYNLGDNNMPFTTWKDVTGKYSDWTIIAPQGRGKFMPVYEMVYNHYVLRKGLSMPYTKQVIEKIRPEGFDRDQPAFGTFLFSVK
ncbi:MAG: alginate lyase family protein [Bacteroidota bacterium]